MHLETFCFVNISYFATYCNNAIFDVVWIILPTLVNIRGNTIFHSDEKLIIINKLDYLNTLDNSDGGMIKEHGSRAVNEGSGTTTDFDVNNRFEQYK